MTAYPMFSFFSQLSLARAVDALRARVGAELPCFGVETRDGSVRIDDDVERALGVIAASASAVGELWLASDAHAFTITPHAGGYLAIAVADFDPELVDAGVPAELREQKRRLAIAIHEALLDAGAVLSYTQSLEDVAAVDDGTDERAAAIASLIERGDLAGAQAALADVPLWLVSVGAEATAGFEVWLDGSFRRLDRTSGAGSAWEHESRRPAFLLPRGPAAVARRVP